MEYISVVLCVLAVYPLITFKTLHMYEQQCKYNRGAEMVAVNASFSSYIVRKIVTFLNEISLSDRAGLRGMSQCVCLCMCMCECVVGAQSFGLFKRPFLSSDK